MTPRRVALVAGLTIGSIGLAWVLMTMVSRVLRSPADPPAPGVAAPAPGGGGDPAVPRIKATLFFAAADGVRLVPVEREVPLGEGTVAQARALVEAQLREPAPEGLVPTLPQGVGLRGIFISDRREAFVDLDAVIRDAHPGGSMNELVTVYTLVNLLTVNLPDVQEVQILIEGREVDTLAGHMDLRRPLRKNENLIADAAAPPDADGQ